MKTDQLYGPQTEYVEALFGRARTMTKEAVDALAATRVTNRSSAWNAAGIAAQAALAVDRTVRSAVRDAAWDAATVAVRATSGIPMRRGRGAATQAAVNDAAWALSVRDLIGQHGFTQEHYDILTLPVRRVLGRIHPDDAEVPA